MSVEMRPYSPHVSEAQEDEGMLVRRGFTRIAPVAYEQQVKEVQAIHTGSPETFLPVEKEHELAVVIQDGLAAHEELARLISDSEAKGRLKERRALAARAKAGRQAERVLVESNLKLSSYLARASMNILPAGDQEALAAGDKTSKAGKRRRALLNDYKPWLPKDFTDLKSRHAVLDDRVQVANLALLDAARKFKPKLSASQKPIPFIAFAAPIIKTELTRYVRGGRPDSHEKPFHVASNTLQEIPHAYWEDWEGHMTPERREELLITEQIQDLLPLDELYFAGAAEEEREDADDDAPLLGAEEVFPSFNTHDPSFETFDNMRSELIERALFTLSEREAGVLRLRFGLLDGQPRTLDEIGEVYGVTRERVRQIENKAMSKMRHPMRTQTLIDFLDLEETVQPPMFSGEVIKSRQTIGHSAVQLVSVSESPEPKAPPAKLESWQVYPGEEWDEPVRVTPEKVDLAYADISDELKNVLLKAPSYTFQKAFAYDVQSPYPKHLAERIGEVFGETLEPAHIAHFWNNHLEGFLQHLTEELGDDASFDRATQLLSRLLTERMTDNDFVELHIPEQLQGQLNYVGAWLKHGTVRIHGEAGNYTGYQMDELGHLQVEGSVRNFAGQQMKGYARLEIDGNAGDFLGSSMSGSASILVNGDAGDYCGYYMRSHTNSVEVLGTVGKHAAMDAAQGAEVSVAGKVVRAEPTDDIIGS